MTRSLALAALAAFALVVAACSTGAPAASGGAVGSAAATAAGSAKPETDKLAQILERGTLIGYHELDYAPLSFDVEGATRPADTKCGPNQLTAGQVDGFDSETTKLVAERLGVEPCFVTPTWTEVTGGNWGDRWDIAYGSGSINADRMTRLWMTQPYYGVDNFFYVPVDSPIQRASLSMVSLNNGLGVISDAMVFRSWRAELAVKPTT